MKKSRGSKGVSLVEAVLTLFLFTVVLSAVGSLLSDSSRLLRRADELSWSNRASDWLNQIESRAMSAFKISVSPGSTSNDLQFVVRDSRSPDFLPDSPIPTWSLDNTSIQIEYDYAITGSRLTESRTPNGGSTTTVDLGLVDKLTVERSSGGNLILTLDKGKETVRREIVLFTLDSLAAPL